MALQQNGQALGRQHVAERNHRRWTSEVFLRAACDAMLSEIDWDTIDSGRLHHASCAGRTLKGLPVVIAVLENEASLLAVLEDVQEEKRDADQISAPLWLYVPMGLKLQFQSDEQTRIRRVCSDPSEHAYSGVRVGR